MSHLPESAPTIASAQSGPWTTGEVPPASRSSRQMAVAAHAFVSALGADQLSKVQYPDLGDAARTQWSNLPAGASPRPGASLADLSDSQRVLLHDLLRASTSTQGYHKMTGAIRAEDVLSQLQGGNQMFGASYYYATVFGSPDDVLAGPGRQSSLSTFQGIAAGQLDDGQQRLLWLLVQEFVRNVDFDAAEAQLALVQQSWGDTHFAWQGPAPDANARYYFRVHGPRILIEYDVQEPLSSSGGHVHAITRDPTNDYGADWLWLHYQETAAGPGGGGAPGGRGGQP